MDIVEEFLEVSKVVAWLHCAISKLCDMLSSRTFRIRFQTLS